MTFGNPPAKKPDPRELAARSAARAAYPNRAHQGAFCKGARAYRNGKLGDANPYHCKTRGDHRNTWSQGHWWAWHSGWQWQSHRPDQRK